LYLIKYYSYFLHNLKLLKICITLLKKIIVFFSSKFTCEFNLLQHIPTYILSGADECTDFTKCVCVFFMCMKEGIKRYIIVVINIEDCPMVCIN
jgi:hypothetical protein